MTKQPPSPTARELYPNVEIPMQIALERRRKWSFLTSMVEMTICRYQHLPSIFDEAHVNLPTCKEKGFERSVRLKERMILEDGKRSI